MWSSISGQSHLGELHLGETSFEISFLFWGTQVNPVFAAYCSGSHKILYKMLGVRVLRNR